MLGCYRKGDAADPDTYAAAVAATLARYPADIVMEVTDPRTGLPSRSNWLPTVAEVHKACEEIDERRRERAAASAREQKQLRERAEYEASLKQRPTIDQLKAKYGPNWGLHPKEESPAHKQHLDAIARANRKVLEREFADSGESDAAEIPVSPSLRAKLTERREAAE